MQLTVLVDNNTLIDRYYLGEPGVAYYLEDGDVRILFDVGYSDIFLRNAQALGIDLSRLQQVVLSHGHNDHTRGLLWLSEQEYFSELQLLAHPDALLPTGDLSGNGAGLCPGRRSYRRPFYSTAAAGKVQSAA